MMPENNQPSSESSQSNTNSKRGYILNFLPDAITIATKNGSYGPIPPDGTIDCQSRYKPMAPNATLRRDFKQAIGIDVGFRSLDLDIKVQVDDRTFDFPSPREGIYILVERRIAPLIAASGRPTSDIIFPLALEKCSSGLKCRSLMTF